MQRNPGKPETVPPQPHGNGATSLAQSCIQDQHEMALNIGCVVSGIGFWNLMEVLSNPAANR